MLTQVGHDRLINRQKALLALHRSQTQRDRIAANSGGTDANVPLLTDRCEQYEEITRHRIAEIDLIFSEGVQIAPKVKGDRVAIGTIITISLNGGDERKFWIDGYAETEPTLDPQVVGYYAPLIRPLIGRCAGDAVTAIVDNSEVDVEILDIRLPTQTDVSAIDYRLAA